MSSHLFVSVHVAISLIGIGSGLVVIFGFLNGMLFRAWNTLFLVSTMITSLTGFLFPFKGITPGIVIGIVSTMTLLLAITALRKHMAKTYVASSTAAEFLNVLVLIVQVFQKVSILHRYAPAGKEPLVAATQLVALLVFTGLAFLAIRKSATIFPA